jgi:S23 ribosomal protein.
MLGMTPAELRERTRLFAIAIVKLCRQVPSDWITRVLGTQLLRSGTSVAANYRAACRGRSDKEFCAKIGVVAEEADESLLWLEFLGVAWPSVVSADHKSLVQEADELTAIFTASHATARANLKNKRAKRKSRNHPITQSPDQ